MALIKRENICIAEEYVSQGQPRKKWHRIGQITTFSNEAGEQYQKVTLVGPHGVTQASVFEDDRGENNAKKDGVPF